MKRLLIALLALGLPLPAAAAPMLLQLSAANMLAQTHSRALLLSTTGTFRQLSGTLRFDAATGACAIDATFVVQSLALPNALMRQQTMSAGFLDPARYPLQHYVATCQGAKLTGNLTMHGQTHAFTMAVRWQRQSGAPATLHAAGTLNRQDWGIDGLKLLVGDTIRVTNDISLNGMPPAPAR